MATLGAVGRSAVARGLALVALVVVSCAATYAKGVDVSNYQGSVDWLQVAGEGYSFAFAKASEGTTFTDVTYAVNRTGTAGIGLRLGAYHFARPAGSNAAAQVTSAIAQADHFVDVAQPKGGDLPPVVDLETNGGLKAPGLVQWTQAFLDEVAARTGLSALIYASPAFWKSSLGDTSAFALAGHRLWIAHWTKNAAPTLPAGNWGGDGWTFWQWSDCQKVAGITSKCVDADRVNGADPNIFAVKTLPTGLPSIATAPSIVGTLRAGTKLSAVPGVWNGGKPVSFKYQWQQCDGSGAGCAPIPGATLETYTPSATSIGHALVVSVTATTKSGATAASSPPSAPISTATGVALPAVVAQPQIQGALQVGQTLTAATGTWSGSPSAYTYAWQRCNAVGADCVAIPNATLPTYVITPGDVNATLTLLVTAKNTAGTTPATSPPSAAVTPASVPPAVVDSLAAQTGVAGAVVTADGRATVTWQPGAVPNGTVVGLTSVGTAVQVGLTPATTLPWAIDIAYAGAPANRVVGVSTDGRIWSPVGAATAPPNLPTGFLTGAYTSADGVQHVLTRKAAQFKLFTPNAWGDPRFVSRYAPRIRRVAPVKITKLGSGVLVVHTRLSAPSQALITPGRRRILKPGAFPVTVRAGKQPRGSVVRVQFRAVDPWGRTATFGISFRAP
jgi:GH25 family lysozyme M1 (1,4-beta-N-acetylmuramidase)